MIKLIVISIKYENLYKNKSEKEILGQDDQMNATIGYLLIFNLLKTEGNYGEIVCVSTKTHALICYS